MSKRTLLQLTFAAAALAPAMPQAQVFFWRDARNVANYADLCPAGVDCGVRPIRMRPSGYVNAAAPQSASATAVSSNTPDSGTPGSVASFGLGGMAGGSGSGGGGAIGGATGGGGGGSGG